MPTQTFTVNQTTAVSQEFSLTGTVKKFSFKNLTATFSNTAGQTSSGFRLYDVNNSCITIRIDTTVRENFLMDYNDNGSHFDIMFIENIGRYGDSNFVFNIDLMVNSDSSISLSGNYSYTNATGVIRTGEISPHAKPSIPANVFKELTRLVALNTKANSDDVVYANVETEYVIPPNAPTDVGETRTGNTSTVTWDFDNGNGDADYFYIYVNDELIGTNNTLLFNVWTGDNTALGRYKIGVSAVNSNGESAITYIDGSHYERPNNPTADITPTYKDVIIRVYPPSQMGGYTSIYSYTVQLLDDSILIDIPIDEQTGTGPTFTFTGLDSDKLYQLRITALCYDIGVSDTSEMFSQTFRTTIPIAVPSIVRNIDVITNGTDITINWTQPSSWGDWTNVQGYFIADDTDSWTYNYPTTTHTFTGELNTTYNFRIYAYNDVGNGQQITFQIKTDGTPEIVLNPRFTKYDYSDDSSLIEWDYPDDDGGSPIISYTLSCNGQTKTTSILESKITGLTLGQEYAATIYATNEYGNGAILEFTFTPATVPDMPTVETSSERTSITIYVTPNGDGGSPITHYEYRVNGGEWIEF